MQTLTQIKTTIRKIARQTQTQIGAIRGHQYTCKRLGVHKGAPVKLGQGLWLIVDPAMAPFEGAAGLDKPAVVSKVASFHAALQAAGLETIWDGRYFDPVMVRVG
jgi:hypothetical protein